MVKLLSEPWIKHNLGFRFEIQKNQKLKNQKSNMQYSATAKYVHTSTRKVRLVADAVRNMPVERAIVLLSHTPKFAAKPIISLIRSAVANAKQKQISSENLVITTVEVMGGPVMKRWHAVSRGMANGYKKRMTHIRVILEEKK